MQGTAYIETWTLIDSNLPYYKYGKAILHVWLISLDGI